MDISERFKEIRKSTGLSQSDFGKAIGVSRDTIANIECGRMEVKELHIKAVCSQHWNVDESWLRTGDGEPFAPQTINQYITDWVNRVMADRDESFRKRFIFALCNMDDRGWGILEQFIKDLSEN